MLRQMLLAASLPLAASAASSKIEHFVVLFMENRPFDHTFGYMKLPGSDYMEDGAAIPGTTRDPPATYKHGSADYACEQGPGYDLWAGKTNPSGGNASVYPYTEQSDQWAEQRGAKGVAITAFGGKKPLPVKEAFAKNFAVFNKFFSSVPSFSTPNHLFAQSATSCGMDDNVNYETCGGSQKTFPQRTIYDNLNASGVPFAIYTNSTPHHADVNMDGVARYKQRFLGYPDFWGAAANGTLPAFSWVLPGTDPRNGKPNNDHPCHDVALGERLQKDIYEALRSGPGWNKTMFLVVYDDAGGFYDHVVPPHEGVPSDDAPCHLAAGVLRGCKKPFDFRRLGERLTSFIVSPWIPKGLVIQEPKGPNSTSQYEHSSISATLKNLYDLPDFLTKRDAWAGSFTELLTLDTPRTDAPLHLPDAPPPSSGANMHGCGGEEEITLRQEKHVELWTRYNGIEEPEGWREWGFTKLQGWIEDQYHVWRHGAAKEEL